MPEKIAHVRFAARRWEEWDCPERWGLRPREWAARRNRANRIFLSRVWLTGGGKTEPVYRLRHIRWRVKPFKPFVHQARQLAAARSAMRGANATHEGADG